jgi:hypothetical protein
MQQEIWARTLPGSRSRVQNIQKTPAPANETFMKGVGDSSTPVM